MLVGLAVLGIDTGRKFINGLDRNVPYENMDVDQLAKRLGILLEDSRTTVRPALRTPLVATSHITPVTVKPNEESRNTISDSDVTRIVEAVLVALKERSKAEITDNVSAPITQKVPEPPAVENENAVALAPAVSVESQMP